MEFFHTRKRAAEFSRPLLLNLDFPCWPRGGWYYFSEAIGYSWLR
jgi:hypothetical protein